MTTVFSDYVFKTVVDTQNPLLISKAYHVLYGQTVHENDILVVVLRKEHPQTNLPDVNRSD